MQPVNNQTFTATQSNYMIPGYPASQQQYMSQPYQKAISSQSEIIGTPSFDPDPVTETYISQSPPQRITAVGPYGPGGQQSQVNGVFKPPPVRTHITTDIQDHPVNVSTSPLSQQYSPQYSPQY